LDLVTKLASASLSVIPADDAETILLWSDVQGLGGLLGSTIASD
jgi:hypothetical protein